MYLRDCRPRPPAALPHRWALRLRRAPLSRVQCTNGPFAWAFPGGLRLRRRRRRSLPFAVQL